MVGGDRDGGRGVVGVEQADAEHRGEDPQARVVDQGQAGLPGLHRRQQRPVIHRGRAGLQVIAGGQALEGVVQRAEVAHHEPGEVQLALEHGAERHGVLAGVLAVDLVERAHHRAQAGAGDHRLEGEGVDLSQGPLVHDRVLAGTAVGLLVVGGVVLQGRDDVVCLHRGGVDAVEVSVQDRVLALALADAAEPWQAGDVGVRGETLCLSTQRIRE